jgi:uncharacterized protein (TIGR02757 family)
MMSLKHHLDSFLESFPRERHLASDPVQFVHRYEDPRDREVAGFIAAALAYGNVKIVLRSVDHALSYLGTRPAQAVMQFDPVRDARRLHRFYHRFNTSRDLAALFWILRCAFEENGSLESAFAGSRQANIGDAIHQFSARMLSYGHENCYPRGELQRRIAVRFFFPSPVDGSACKRMNLFLRWMVRPEDGIDCGVWSRLKPSQLVIPLDTHIARISSYIGLTELKSPGWRMAVDITNSLSKLHAEDPLRYDFALCHMGIAGDCPRKRDPVKCRRCPIQAVCRL